MTHDPMTGTPAPGWSLRRRLLNRVVIGVAIGWLVGLAFGLWIIAHEMGELLDETLEDSARFSLALYQAGGAVNLPAADDASAIRIIDKGREVIGADWPPLAEDGGMDVGDWRVHRLSDPVSGVVIETGQSNEWRRDELLESLVEREKLCSTALSGGLAEWYGFQRGHQLAQFLVAEEGGRAAAQVQLAHGVATRPASFGQLGQVQGQLGLQQGQVLGAARLVARDDFVAGAVVAQLLAIRDVHVDRQRPRRASAGAARHAQGAAVVGLAKGLDEAVCGGV